MPLDPTLARIPGLAGYLAMDQYNRGAEADTAQQAGRMNSLETHFREREREAQSQAELKALGPAPTREALIRWASKWSPPKDVLNQLQHAETSKNQQAVTKEATVARLQQAASQFESTYELKRQAAKSKQEQDAIDNIFKTRKSLLDEQARREAGVQLHWNTGLDVSQPALPPVPAAPQGRVSATLDAPDVGINIQNQPAGMVADLAARDPQFAGGMARAGGVASVDQPQALAPIVLQAPASQPSAPSDERFFHPDMPEEIKQEIRNAPPKDKSSISGKWREANFGPKAQQQFSKDTADLKGLNDALDRMKSQVKLVKDAKLRRVTGIPGWIPNVPGMAGSVATARLDSLRSKAMIDTLSMLKGISATGASGFGNLTEREGQIIQGYIDNLSTATDETELRRVLDNVETYVDAAKARLDAAYKAKHATRIGTPGRRSAADLEERLRRY